MLPERAVVGELPLSHSSHQNLLETPAQLRQVEPQKALEKRHSCHQNQPESLKRVEEQELHQTHPKKNCWPRKRWNQNQKDRQRALWREQ